MSFSGLNTIGRYSLILAICLLAGAAGLELGARFLLDLDDEDLGRRAYLPYFGSGHFKIHSTLKSLEQGREGPGRFGYRKRSGYYLYDPETETPDGSDRFGFLLENWLSPYRAARIREIELRAPGAFRIFVIGGSTAMGTSASSAGKTWSNILEETLGRDFPDQRIFVFNAAVGGFVTTQERLALELAVLPRRPGLILHLTGFNDLSLPLRNGSRPGDPYQTGLRYFQVYGNSLLRAAVEHSAAARCFFRNRISGILSRREAEILADRSLSDPLAEEIARVCRANLQAMHRRCVQEKTPYLAFFQPYNLSAGRAGPDLAGKRKRFYDRIRKLILDRTGPGEDRIPLLDLGPAFGAESARTLFTDEVHLNDAGQEALARAVHPLVHQEMARLIRERRSPPPRTATDPGQG